MSETPKSPENPELPDQTEKFGPDFQQKLQNLESGVSLEEQEVIDALPSGSALLIVRKGPNAGARFLLDQDSTVAGRHPAADIFLDDVTVSRRHAEFVRHATAFEVKDMGSLNGTYFDGVLIDQALLHDGAEVQVGKFRMTFFPSRSDVDGARSAQ
jgi:pSer/pThr/pTyr-binding forkhead associated (FHA) protein